MFSEDEVSLFYKNVEKSEEKIFKRGDCRAGLVLFRGGGVYNKNILHIVLVYTI